MVFSVSYSEIILYAAIFFNGLQINTSADIIDLIICLLTIGGALYLIIKAVLIVREANKVVRKEGTVTSFSDVHQSTQIIYAGFKDDAIIKLSFMVFFIFRAIVIFSIVVILIGFPLI